MLFIILHKKSACKYETFVSPIYGTTITKYNNHNVLIILNSCDNYPKSDNDKLITTKPDKKHIELVLIVFPKHFKKYNDDFSWDYDDTKKEFIATIMLLNK